MFFSDVTVINLESLSVRELNMAMYFMWIIAAPYPRCFVPKTFHPGRFVSSSFIVSYPALIISHLNAFIILGLVDSWPLLLFGIVLLLFGIFRSILRVRRSVSNTSLMLLLTWSISTYNYHLCKPLKAK